MPPLLAAPPMTKCLESHAAIVKGLVSLAVTTCSRPSGAAVPMPTPPEARMRNWSFPVEVKSALVESAQANVP